MSGPVEVVTLPVVFTTKTQYLLPSQKFMIPAAWRRYQLSQLVNKALALAQPVPFDFFVRGEGLRGSLKEWCEERGVGSEETLEIEYVESLMPPKHAAYIPHECWVAAVSCQVPGFFLTASYDSFLRIFDASRSLIQTISGHTAPITSIAVVESSDSASVKSCTIATVSHDGTGRITSVPLASEPGNLQKYETLATLQLHSGPISSISVSSSGSYLTTAGWDTVIGVWNTMIPTSDEASVPNEDLRVSKKRRRTNGEGRNGIRKTPVSILKSHTSQVTGAIFGKEESGEGEGKTLSCSLDSTVRIWDVERGLCVNTLTASEKPFLSIAHLNVAHVIAASSTDRTVTLYDTRSLASAKSSVVTQVSIASLQHPALISSLSPSPNNPHQIASGSYDGVVRIWDVRNTKGAVANFRAGDGDDARNGDGKILSIDWTTGVMAIGGEAGLDIWRVPERAEL